MKKLLSLLSVLTISGATMPNVIAASSYQKQNNNKNSKIINKTKIVIKTNNVVADRGVVLNNKLYFGS